MSLKTRTIIPVKRLEESKTSFSEVLSDEQRKELTLSMLEDILRITQKVEKITTTVVTPDRTVINFVEKKGIGTIQEPDIGLNRALEMAIKKTIEANFQQVLIIPADIPLIRPKDIGGILDLASGERSVVITPSEENGTNALLLRPPDVIGFRFGGESFPEHVKAARSREVGIRIYRSVYVERDIDNPSSLIKIETLGKGTKTHDLLNSLK